MKEKMNALFLTLGRICLLGVVVASPWRNGSFEPFPLRILFFLILASAVCALAALWTTPQRARRLNSYWASLAISIPLALGLGLCFLQIAPLPESAIFKLSPSIETTKLRLLPPLVASSSPDFQENLKQILESNEYGDLIETRAKELADFYDESYFNSVAADLDFDLRRAVALDAAVETSLANKSRKTKLDEWGRVLSVYPLATRELLPQFCIAWVLLLSTSILFNTTQSRRALFATVAWTGVAFALFAIAGRANPSLLNRIAERRDMWWLIGERLAFGGYANKNAAAGFLVLSYAACFFFFSREFLVAARLKRKDLKTRKHEQLEEERSESYKMKSDSKWKAAVADFFDLFNRKLVLWLFATGATYAAILASLSRGGAIAATVATLTALFAIFLRRESRRFVYIPCLVFFFALAFLVSVNLRDNVDERISTLVETNELGENAVGGDARLKNWASAIKTWRAYPILGSGLGTYSLANYSADEALSSNHLFYYAENTFVQTLVELGLVGELLLLATYVLLICFTLRYLVGEHSIETTALGVSALALVSGQIISSCVDFGIYLPGNLFVFTALCGGLIARQKTNVWEKLNAALSRRETAKEASRRIKSFLKKERIGALVFTAVLIAAASFGKFALRENADYVERARLLRSAKIDPETLSSFSPTGLNGLVSDFRKFVSRRDDCYEIRLALANLALIKFRLGYYDYLKTSMPEKTKEELWSNSRHDEYLQTLLHYQSLGFDVATKAMREKTAVVEALQTAVAELYAARRICPLQSRSFAPAAAYLAALPDMTWDDERQLEVLYALRKANADPYDSIGFIQNALYLGSFRLQTLKCDFLKRVLASNPYYVKTVLQTLAVGEPESALVRDVDYIIPNDLQFIWRAAAQVVSSDNPSLIKAIRTKYETAQTATPEGDRDYFFYLHSGVFCKIVGDYQRADEELEKATERDPDGKVDSEEKAFFVRMQLLIDQSNVLQKDQECVDALQQYCQKRDGVRRWKAEELLKQAQEKLNRSSARLEAREKLRREQEQMSSLRGSNSSDSEVVEEVAPEENNETSKSIDEIERALLQ